MESHRVPATRIPSSSAGVAATLTVLAVVVVALCLHTSSDDSAGVSAGIREVLNSRASHRRSPQVNEPPPVLYVVDERGKFGHLRLLEAAFERRGFVVRHGSVIPRIPMGETRVIVWTFQSPFDAANTTPLTALLRHRHGKCPVARLNHIPGMGNLLNKRRLGPLLTRAAVRHPKSFYSAEEVVVPSQNQVLVAKNGNHGGVEFVNSWNERVLGGAAFWRANFLQEKVHGMKINGLTFDIGLYTLMIPEDSVLATFVHSTPLVRFCPSSSPNCKIHRYKSIWNVPTLREQYKQSDGDSQAVLMHYLDSNGHDGSAVFREMKEMAAKSANAAHVDVQKAAPQFMDDLNTSLEQVFEFARFDFIIEERTAKPYLIEVNLSPNLSPLDKDRQRDTPWRLRILDDLAEKLYQSPRVGNNPTGFQRVHYSNGPPDRKNLGYFRPMSDRQVEPEPEGEVNRISIWVPPLIGILVVALNVGYLFFKVLQEARTQERTDNDIFEAVPLTEETSQHLGNKSMNLLASSKKSGSMKVLKKGIPTTPDCIEPVDFLPPTAIYAESPRQHLAHLLRIAFPSIISIVLAPLCIELGSPFITFLFFGQAPAAFNEAVGAFLAASSLMYGIIFGFTYQACMQKNLATQALVSREFVVLRTLSSLADCFDSVKVGPICRIKAIIASEALSLSRIQSDLPDAIRAQFVMMHRIWEIVEAARQASTDGINDDVDLVILGSTLQLVSELSAIIGDRITCLSRVVNCFQWVFLEFLAFMSFFGVLLIRTSSTGLDKTICFLSVFTITTLTWVIADLDDPYHGWYRVDFRQGDKFMVEAWQTSVRCFQKVQANPNEAMGDRVESRVLRKLNGTAGMLPRIEPEESDQTRPAPFRLRRRKSMFAKTNLH